MWSQLGGDFTNFEKLINEAAHISSYTNQNAVISAVEMYLATQNQIDDLKKEGIEKNVNVYVTLSSIQDMLTFRPIDRCPTTKVVLSVRRLERKNVFKNIQFVVHEGERLGVAGLVGAGRTEIMRAIFGIDRLSDGEITLNGEKVCIDSPQKAIKSSIGLLPEDRKTQGLILESTVCQNISLASLRVTFWIDKRKHFKILIVFV